MIKVAIAYSDGLELKIDLEEYNSLEELKEVFDINQEVQKDFLDEKTVDVSVSGELSFIRLIKEN